MKKFLLLIFFIFPGVIYASSSSYTASSTCGSNNNFSNCANALNSDNTYSTAVGGSSTLQLYNFGFHIPTNATIDSIDFSLENKASGSGGFPNIRNLLFNIYKEGSAGYYGSISGSCNTARTIAPSDTEGIQYVTLNSSCWPTHTPTADDINNSNFGVSIDTSTNGSPTYSIDQLLVRINYTVTGAGYSLVIDSSTASPSGQFVSLDISGETATVSATMMCQVSLFERCSKSGYASFLSQTPVAHINLYGASTATSTIDHGGGYYDGYSWGPPQRTFLGKNIHVPYNDGWTCDYPTSFYCSENHTVVSQVSYQDDSRLVATPSASTAVLFTEPEPSNPLAWVVWKLKQVFWELFGFGQPFDAQMYDSLKQNFETKAPFAYANAVLALDWSSSTEATTAPTISIPLVHREGVLPATMDWTAPQVFFDMMGMVRTGIKIFIWLVFVAYLFFLSRRIFQ